MTLHLGHSAADIANAPPVSWLRPLLAFDTVPAVDAQPTDLANAFVTEPAD